MTHLDVAFANLYFAAASTAEDPAAVPLPWRPLVQQRAVAGIEPVQFALAGMNAHINHDLPVAVASTCTALATSPDAGSHFADYQKVDQLLDAAEQSIRQSFESSDLLAVDQHLSAVATLTANWSINSARDMAWTNCLLLWEVRDDPIARGLLLDSLAASPRPAAGVRGRSRGRAASSGAVMAGRRSCQAVRQPRRGIQRGQPGQSHGQSFIRSQSIGCTDPGIGPVTGLNPRQKPRSTARPGPTQWGRGSGAEVRAIAWAPMRRRRLVRCRARAKWPAAFPARRSPGPIPWPATGGQQRAPSTPSPGQPGR